MCWFLGVSITLMNTFTGQMQASLTIRMEKPRIDSLLDLYHHPDILIHIPQNSVLDTVLLVCLCLAIF